jgi:hypothetical protein
MKARTMISSMAVLVSLVFTAQAETPPSFEPARDSLAWSVIDTGVAYAVANDALGNDAFIGFGGWTVQQAWANHWVSSLDSAKLHGLGIRYFYSVRGPQQDDYSGREIGTLSLARHFIALAKTDTLCRRVIIAAHSSGAYVAHALFQDLYDGASIDSEGVTPGKIIYFNLDGGIGAAGTGVLITQTMVDRLVHVYGVYAFNPTYAMYSPNKAEMVDLGNLFGAKSSSMEISARGCGCTGIWCVHETLINQKPYNATTFDLKNDYGMINAAHPVTTKYLDVVTGIREDSPSAPGPVQFRLEQNYPNPFNGQTSIIFQLSAPSFVSLKVFDLLGRETATLVQEKKPAGRWAVQFNAPELSSGVYFFRLRADAQWTTKRMMLIR